MRVLKPSLRAYSPRLEKSQSDKSMTAARSVCGGIAGRSKSPDSISLPSRVRLHEADTFSSDEKKFSLNILTRNFLSANPSARAWIFW